MLRVGGFDYLDMNSTDSIAIAVYFCGCTHNCTGCHNKQLQDFTGGDAWYSLKLAEHLIEQYRKGGYDYVVLLGGEPLQQNRRGLRTLLQYLNDNEINVYMYTGYEYDEVPNWCKDLCYCIKTGKYDTDFPKEGKLATGNQRYYFKDGRVEK